jgi:hypothetical protein
VIINFSIILFYFFVLNAIINTFDTAACFCRNKNLSSGAASNIQNPRVQRQILQPEKRFYLYRAITGVRMRQAIERFKEIFAGIAHQSARAISNALVVV